MSEKSKDSCCYLSWTLLVAENKIPKWNTNFHTTETKFPGPSQKFALGGSDFEDAKSHT